jgi:hypothetical protein
VVVGLAFVASGVLGLLGRTPPPATPGAAVMMHGLAAAGYFIPLLCLVQIAAGALFVAGRWLGLGVSLLAPVAVEIAAYRIYVAAATPVMLVVTAVLVTLTAYLAFANRGLFRAAVAAR